jgi:hypothetical protein
MFEGLVYVVHVAHMEAPNQAGRPQASSATYPRGLYVPWGLEKVTDTTPAVCMVGVSEFRRQAGRLVVGMLYSQGAGQNGSLGDSKCPRRTTSPICHSRTCT